MSKKMRVSNLFRKRLRHELDIWENEGILNGEQAQQISLRYRLDQLKKESLGTLLSAIYIIGAILIAGGVGKGADFSPMVSAINKWGKEVVLIGEAAAEIAAHCNEDIKTCFADDMQAAVELGLQHAVTGDAVLLSPACASFDMFENFQDRGHVFVQCVEKLQ